ncbi:hypothetical protein C2845_PM03G18100 [Panicum miliaceum]|uniref:Ubiquitin-like protease family profile domain-containing protein n=1 Tax=Panicum miliaceum TaxID=4540 RepID=A0A3L6T7L5_PANMI|nr:hypothetical protein C2845_PM03G18100 [Panicum miliaceum]
MARQRHHPNVDVSSAESDDVSIEEVQCSQLPSVNESDTYHSISENKYLSDASSHSDDSSFNHALFEQVMRDISDSPTVNHTRDKQMRTVQPIPNNNVTLTMLKFLLNPSSSSLLLDILLADSPDYYNFSSAKSPEVKSPKVQITGSRSLDDNISNMMDKVRIVKFAFGPEPKIQAYPTQSSLDSDFADALFGLLVSSLNKVDLSIILSLLHFVIIFFANPTATLTSKCHYFFANVADNLLKHPNEANGDYMMKAFKQYGKTRPLSQTDLLHFPTFFENHGSLFIVDIKDSKFVFLDSYFRKDDDYQVNMREQLGDDTK